MSDSSIQINITIAPATNGKRKIIVAGAPEGEMPHIVTGDFSQLHAKVDEVYVALLKRKPQTVKVPKDKSKDLYVEGGPKAKGKPKADQLVQDDADDEPAETETETPVRVDRQVITPDAAPKEEQLQLTLEETTDEEN